MTSKEKSISPNENFHPTEMGTPSRKRLHERKDAEMTPTTSRNRRMSSDDDFEEEDEAMELDEAQAAKKPREHNARDDLAVAGRVAGVHLQNFMCHANLSIDFDTDHNNCFYIGGPNGSGKSALFAAINIGLGGKGSDNDRGNTVKSYIKDGTQSAKICITLTNVGQNSHPDYGDLVAIERTINQSSSTYIIKSITRIGKSVKEEIVSKKKCDVDRLVDRFNIHLSNPAFWMSQDRSRSFLANFKPGNVFKLYQEATNLEKIKQSYMQNATLYSDYNRMMTVKQVDIAKKTKELKRLNEIRQLHDKIQQDQQDVDMYQWNLLFCSIRDVEDDLKMISKKIEKNVEMAEENKKAMLDNREERRTIMRSVQELTDDIEDKKTEFDGLNDDMKELKNRKEDEEQAKKQFDKDINKKEGEIETIRTRIRTSRKTIQKLTEKAGNDDMKRKLARAEEKLEEYRDERNRMEKSGTGAEMSEKLKAVEKEVNSTQNRLYDARTQIEGKKRKIEEYKDKIKRSKAVKSNKINKFGSRMADIVGEIERNSSRFGVLPKGPIGKYVSVLDSKWSYPVEECIGNLAPQFICNDSRDAAVLRNVFENLRLQPRDKPNLIVSRFLGRPHDNLQEPDMNFSTVYRMLQISDVDVHNALIDKNQIESILLLANNRDAMKYMDSSRPPNNATKAYTLDGSQAFAGGPNGQYRFYAGRASNARGMFDGGDEVIDEQEIANEISKLQEEIERIQYNDLKEATDDQRSIAVEHKKIRIELEAFEKRLAEVRNLEIRTERDVRDFQANINNEDDLEEINMLNNAIDDCEKRIRIAQEEIEQIREAKREALQKTNPSADKLQKLQQEHRKHSEELRKQRDRLTEFETKATKLDQAYQRMTSTDGKYEGAKQAFFNDEQQLKKNLDDIKKMVEENKVGIPKPPQCSDPPDLSNFPPTLDANRIYKEKVKRVEAAKAGIDESVTMESVSKFKDEVKKEKMMVKRIIELLNNMTDVLQTRVDMYPSMKKYTETKVRLKFQKLLATRGHFIGDLVFDYERETLNVVVTSSKDKDAQNLLNGGEDGDDEEEDRRQAEDDDGFIDDDDDSDAEPAKKKSKKAKKPAKKKVKDLKGLSGGERSFVTAALVMALWEVMEQPFRMMDEFDVFMDMMNRKIVMDLLVKMATTEFPHNQFIFFTPQGIKELDKVDGLQIFEMNKVRD